MRVDVAELWPTPQVDSAVLPDIGGDAAVLYLPIPARANLRQLDALVHRIPSRIRRSADAVVIRAHSPEAAQILGDAEWRATLAHRIESQHRGLWLLHDDGRTHDVVALDGPPRWDEDARTRASERVRGLVPGIREAELRALSAKSGVLLPDVEEFHYLGPNGRHYTSFIRVATALHSVDVVDALAFWLLPYLRQSTVLLLDSWTILALGLNCARYVADRGPTDRPHVLAVECAREYNEAVDEIARRLEILRIEQPSPHGLIVMSVMSTGSLHERLVDACHRAGLHETQTVALYGSPDCESERADEIFCRLDAGCRGYRQADCPRCAIENPRVVIQPDTYLLELSAAIAMTTKLNDAAAQARAFFETYAKTPCVSVHRDQDDGSRHHMVYLDVERLLDTETFREHLIEKTTALRGQADVILCPTHPAGRGLALMVSRLLGLPPPIVADEQTLGNLPDHSAAALRDAARILIVDDVVITGDRLRNYRYFLHEAGLLGEDAEINLLVGVDRTPNEQTRRAITDMVHGARHFAAVETLILPNWGKDECPWCWEYRNLDELAALIPPTPVIQTRFEALRRTGVGLHENLFLAWSPTGKVSLMVRKGSIFGPVQDAALVASAASTLQRLRSDGQLNEVHRTPLARILDPTFVFRGRFYDPIIVAALLRVSRSHDLRATAVEAILSRHVNQRLSERSSSQIRAEFLLATAQQKLPHTPRIVDESSDLYDGEPGACGFLRRLLGVV